MKLKSLLLTIGIISGVAYANIPGTAPYKSITTIRSNENALVAVDAKGIAYITDDGQRWSNLFAFSLKNSNHYFAYTDYSGNGYFISSKGDEFWKYDSLTNYTSSYSSTFPSLGLCRNIRFIGMSYDRNQTEYALTALPGGLSPQIYSRSNTQDSWVKLSNTPSSYLTNFMAIGSESGDYMVLGKNDTKLYNVSGLVNDEPLPCNNVSPSFLGVLPGFDYLGLGVKQYRDTYYLMCGMGNNARLYSNDGNTWNDNGEIFAPSAGDSTNYSYVMASYPVISYGRYKLSNGSSIFWSPKVFIIIENHTANASGVSTGPDYGRLCLKTTHTECGTPFYIPPSTDNSQVYSGSIFQDTNLGELHAIFVGNSSSGFVLDIPIDIAHDRASALSILSPGAPVWK